MFSLLAQNPYCLKHPIFVSFHFLSVSPSPQVKSVLSFSSHLNRSGPQLLLYFCPKTATEGAVASFKESVVFTIVAAACLHCCPPSDSQSCHRGATSTSPSLLPLWAPLSFPLSRGEEEERRVVLHAPHQKCVFGSTLCTAAAAMQTRVWQLHWQKAAAHLREAGVLLWQED